MILKSDACLLRAKTKQLTCPVSPPELQTMKFHQSKNGVAESLYRRLVISRKS